MIEATLVDVSGAELGLICGYRFHPGTRASEIPVQDIAQALADSQTLAWLHFNLSDLRVRKWLQAADALPKVLRDSLQELDGDRKVEAVANGMLLVTSDFSYDDADPADVSSLWCYADSHTLITARLHALKSPDTFRHRVREGVVAQSGIELLSQLLDARNTRLRQLAAGMSSHLDRIEDEILAGNIKQQREYLGRTRRTGARLRRQFGPERADFAKFIIRNAALLSALDREALQSNLDNLAFSIEEVAEIYERAKLLQEELASRLAESTSRNLYTLSVLTAVLLPMTLVTGIFGMNVPGLPGMQEQSSFWHVMLLIVASGGVTVAGLLWRKLL